VSCLWQINDDDAIMCIGEHDVCLLWVPVENTWNIRVDARKPVTDSWASQAEKLPSPIVVEPKPQKF
jgi:hypothetical protein